MSGRLIGAFLLVTLQPTEKERINRGVHAPSRRPAKAGGSGQGLWPWRSDARGSRVQSALQARFPPPRRAPGGSPLKRACTERTRTQRWPDPPQRGGPERAFRRAKGRERPSCYRASQRHRANRNPVRTCRRRASYSSVLIRLKCYSPKKTSRHTPWPPSRESVSAQAASWDMDTIRHRNCVPRY